jgi:hypothetical protein
MCQFQLIPALSDLLKVGGTSPPPPGVEHNMLLRTPCARSVLRTTVSIRVVVVFPRPLYSNGCWGRWGLIVGLESHNYLLGVCNKVSIDLRTSVCWLDATPGLPPCLTWMNVRTGEAEDSLISFGLYDLSLAAASRSLPYAPRNCRMLSTDVGCNGRARQIAAAEANRTHMSKTTTLITPPFVCIWERKDFCGWSIMT